MDKLHASISSRPVSTQVLRSSYDNLSAGLAITEDVRSQAIYQW